MRILLLALLFAVPCVAQSPVLTGANKTILPDAPKPKVSRRVFLGGVSLLAASKTADAITTRQLLDRGGWENNSWLGRHPSNGRLSGLAAAEFVGQGSLFYLTEHNRRSWIRWTGRAYLGLVIVNHVKLAACNSKIDPHSPTAHSCKSLPL
jgi:hypothetical protein